MNCGLSFILWTVVMSFSVKLIPVRSFSQVMSMAGIISIVYFAGLVGVVMYFADK